ncbi:Nn.00g059000.m01.CDS01 [Neocucurbitaria sp. VM-36]
MQQFRPRSASQIIEERLRSNERGIIDNPLNYRDEKTELPLDVKRFFKDYKLQNVTTEETILRGARLAQDDQRFQKNYALSEDEKRALEREQDPRLSGLTRTLKLIMVTCCIAATTQGWSQASITGANLQWPIEFGLQQDLCHPIRKPWTFGIVNAGAHFSATVAGTWVSDPFNEYFSGRRGALFAAAVFTTAASIGAAFTHTWQQLLVCRILLGIGYGAKGAIVPIYIAEIAPARIRGRLLVSWQTFVAFGIFLSSAVNLIFHPPSPAPNDPCSFAGNWRTRLAWRLQIGSCVLPAIPLLLLVFRGRESPAWNAKQGNYCSAFQDLCRLRDTPLQAARDLYSLYSQLRVEILVFSKVPDIETKLADWSDDTEFQQQLSKSTFLRRLSQFLTISINRRAALAGCIVVSSQILSGINIFAFLAATLLDTSVTNDGLGGTVTPPKQILALWQSFGFAAANALFSPVAYWFIDTKGRRWLLLTSLLAMFPLLLAMAFSFLSTSIAMREIFLILYTMAYSPGAGAVPYLYASEIFPLPNREVGMSMVCSLGYLLAAILGLTVPPLIHHLGRTRLLALFSGLDLIAAVFVWLIVPETEEVMTLEKMSYVFGVPTRRHIQYQVKTVLPYMLRRCVPRSRPEHLPPLYIWHSRRKETQTRQGNRVEE